MRAEEEKDALREELYRNPVKFATTLLPHIFPSEVPWFHYGIWALLTRKSSFLSEMSEWAFDKLRRHFVWTDENDIEHPVFWKDDRGCAHMAVRKYTLLVMPRGFSKTSIAGIAAPLYDILFEEHPYFLYVSETGTHAGMQVEAVKAELTDNELIKELFGDLKPDRSDQTKKWQADRFETTTGIAMLARGRGSQVRGQLHKARRPTKIICDDLEDEEAVATEEQRLKLRNWFFAALEPALQSGPNSNSTITYLNTLMAAEALPVHLFKNPDWSVVKLGVLDKDGDPLWAYKMDLQGIEAKKSSFARQGMLDAFYREYMSEARNPDTQPFKQEYFRYGPFSHGEILGTAIALDPAISEKLTADRSTIHVVTMLKNGRILVRDNWGKRTSDVREVIDVYFDMAKRYNCTIHGIESVAFQSVLVHIMREEMFRKKYYFEIKEIRHGTKKTERIRGILQPRYAGGYITHCRVFPELEAELLEFPGGRHDDYPDSLAMAIALLDPYAAAAGGDIDPSEPTLEPIEDVVGYDWGNPNI